MAHGPYVRGVQGRYVAQGIRGTACLGRPGTTVIEKDRADTADGPYLRGVQDRYAPQVMESLRLTLCVPCEGTLLAVAIAAR